MDPDVTQIESARFGTLDVSPESIIEFPRGLIGIGGSRYALVGDQGAAFVWLHSTDDPGLALPVTDPWRFFPDFEVRLSDAETARCAFPEDASPEVWVTVRVDADPQTCTANLRAPILVHAGQAHQVLNEAPDAEVRAALFAAQPEPAIAQA